MECRYRMCLTNYGFAVLTTVVATWARLSLDEPLGDRMPFGLYFLSVMLTVWVAGVGPAVLSLVLGIVAAAHWVIVPPNSIYVSSPADQISLAVYALVGSASIAIYWRSECRQNAVNLQSHENAELTEQLRDADRRKNNWLALLAHELRNPLAPLRSSIDLLDRQRSSPDQLHEIQRTMRRQTEQLIRIVEDLLDVSRYTRGQLRLECTTVDLRDIVQEAIEMTAPLIAEQDHNLKYVACCQPLMVEGDAARLVQVVSNLLSNAAKYTPRGGRIQVLMEGDDEFAKVSVVDNGIGIALEMQECVFELFAQADNPRNRDRQGLGIGLAIVKSLVEMHHGVVALHSDGPGKGSRFTVTLPRASKSAISAAPPPEAPQAESPADSLQNAIVLLIDDNREAVQTLESLLALDGCQTYTAFDGPSGLEALMVVQPDFVLLDIGMPGMDGYEVVRRIRREVTDLRPTVVAVSGWGSDADRARALQAGFDEHLVKPVDYRELTALLLEQKRRTNSKSTDSRISPTSDARTV